MFNRIFTIIIGLSLVACGNSNSTDQKTGDSSQKEKETTKAKTEVVESAEKELVEITLIAKGEDMGAISFEPKSLSIPAGSKMKLTFKNESEAAGMLHNFVLVKLGTGQEVAAAGIKAGKDKNFVPESENVIAYTKVLELGSETVLEFDAPAKGSYHYICTYPGHYPNMIGRLNVE